MKCFHTNGTCPYAGFGHTCISSLCPEINERPEKDDEETDDEE